jgi:poly(A) polymerase
MLERISKFFKPSKHSNNDGAYVYGPSEHCLSPEMINRDARNVVDVLHKAGHEAYVVGGCVRDLLLGLKPKDFDVATSAKPWEVKSLFRRSRIIGRRFQIVHVQFSREIIEVTTFRSNENQSSNKNHRQQNDSGMLTRDNVFGTVEEDASRRDLTVNALYYDPSDNSIHDFTHGLDDIDDRIIRIIGDPSTRFREDPVRLLRVARFAAKLGFDVDPSTAKPMKHRAGDLQQVSPPRLFDETLKLFMSGNGLTTFKLLLEYKLFEYIVPQLSPMLNDKQGAPLKLVGQAMINTDKRIRNSQRVTPAFIYAALLWPVVQRLANNYEKNGNSPPYALSKAAGDIIAAQIPVTAIPKRFTIPMREIWDLQLHLKRRGGNRAKRLTEHPRFRAAYDFILLREQAGEDLDGLGQWWTEYQDVDEDQRQTMAEEILNKDKRPKRRRRRRNSPKPENSPKPDNSPEPENG